MPRFPDLWVTGVCLVSFFCYFCGLVTVETLLQPMSAHIFGWNDDDSILYLGIFVACQGILSAFVFSWVGPLAKRIDERYTKSSLRI